jgi:hypothetical protein
MEILTALSQFVDAVEELTAGVLRDVGEESASRIITKCQALKAAIAAEAFSEGWNAAKRREKP